MMHLFAFPDEEQDGPVTAQKPSGRMQTARSLCTRTKDLWQQHVPQNIHIPVLAGLLGGYMGLGFTLLFSGSACLFLAGLGYQKSHDIDVNKQNKRIPQRIHKPFYSTLGCVGIVGSFALFCISLPDGNPEYEMRQAALQIAASKETPANTWITEHTSYNDYIGGWGKTEASITLQKLDCPILSDKLLVVAEDKDNVNIKVYERNKDGSFRPKDNVPFSFLESCNIDKTRPHLE